MMMPRMNAIYVILKCLASLLGSILISTYSIYAQELNPSPIGLRPWCKVISSEHINRSSLRFDVQRINYNWEGLTVTLSGDQTGTYWVHPIIGNNSYSWLHRLSQYRVNLGEGDYDCTMGWCVPNEYVLQESSEVDHIRLFKYQTRDWFITFNELGYLVSKQSIEVQGAVTSDYLGQICGPFSCKLSRHTYTDREGLLGGSFETKDLSYVWSGNHGKFYYEKDRPSNAYRWDFQPKTFKYGEVTVSSTGQVLSYTVHNHRGESKQDRYTYDCQN